MEPNFMHQVTHQLVDQHTDWEREEGNIGEKEECQNESEDDDGE